MRRLFLSFIPGLLVLAGVLAMIMSSLAVGGVSAHIGLPLFLLGFVWLGLAGYLQRRRST
ncbi:MAG: hypothetical protein ABW068_11410 [Candidatus Thiodiazotropha sp.]